MRLTARPRPFTGRRARHPPKDTVHFPTFVRYTRDPQDPSSNHPSIEGRGPPKVSTGILLLVESLSSLLLRIDSKEGHIG
jgi:hypothetical protein